VAAIAFFPWLKLINPLAVGYVRLIPYERGSVPGDTERAKQADLDGMLSAYADRPDRLLGIVETYAVHGHFDYTNFDSYQARAGPATGALAGAGGTRILRVSRGADHFPAPRCVPRSRASSMGRVLRRRRQKDWTTRQRDIALGEGLSSHASHPSSVARCPLCRNTQGESPVRESRPPGSARGCVR
jgi:hypothetical protein